MVIVFLLIGWAGILGAVALYACDRARISDTHPYLFALLLAIIESALIGACIYHEYA